MKKLFIEDVKTGADPDGIACGPVSGPSAAEVKLRDEYGKEFYMCLVEAGGFPNLYKTDKSTFGYHVGEMDDVLTAEEMRTFFKKLNENCFIPCGDWSEIYEEPDYEYFDVLRYLVYVLTEDDGIGFMNATKGKYFYEFEIPEGHIEKEYRLDSEE